MVCLPQQLLSITQEIVARQNLESLFLSGKIKISMMELKSVEKVEYFLFFLLH